MSELLAQLLNETKSLSTVELNQVIGALQNLKALKIQKTFSDTREVPNELPSLSVPIHFTPPFLENVFISFVKEVFRNYDKDYRYTDYDVLSNDNSVTVKSYFDPTDLKDGQYPKIAVKCENMNLNPMAFNHTQANAQTYISDSSYTQNSMCMMNISLSMDIICANDSESDTIATLLAAHLVQNMPALKDLGNLYQIQFPSVYFSQKIRDYSNLYMSKINFGVVKEVYWSELVQFKTYSNIIIDLFAVCKDRPECSGLEQIIYNSVYDTKDPTIQKYLQELHIQAEEDKPC